MTKAQRRVKLIGVEEFSFATYLSLIRNDWILGVLLKSEPSGSQHSDPVLTRSNGCIWMSPGCLLSIRNATNVLISVTDM